MFEGYLQLGGGEVINSSRAVTLATSGQCPSGWFQCDPCDEVEDAFPSTGPFEDITTAPWYDPISPMTERFYGAYGLSIEGIPDSTRGANVAQGNLDGGVVGRVRRTTREVKVRALLTAHGKDALEAGVAWLDSALSPGRCGTHALSCGVADLNYLTDCPPPHVLYVPHTEQTVTNLATNPSFETAAATQEIRRNTLLNPNMQTWTNWTTLATTGTWSNGGILDVAADRGPSTLGPYNTAVAATVPGEIWTGSMNIGVPVSYPASLVRLSVVSYDSGGASGAIFSSSNVLIQPGTTVRLTASGTMPALATGVRVIPYIMDQPTAGRRLVFSQALLEKSPTMQPYFDGRTPPAVRQNRHVNPNSAGTGNPILGWVGVTGSSGEPIVYGASTYTDNFPAPVGAIVGGRVRLMSPGGGTMTVVARETLNGSFGLQPTIQSKAVTLAPGVAQEVTVGGPIGGATSNGWRINLVLGGMTDLRVLGTQIEDGTAAPSSIFSGATAADPTVPVAYAWTGAVNASASYAYDSDYTVSWTGTADASASITSSASVVTVTAGNSKGVWSTAGAASRGHALRIVPAGNSNVTSAIIGVTLLPGRTYTALATAYITAPVTATGGYGRRITFVQTGFAGQASDLFPNTAGFHQVRLVFTTDPAMGSYTLRLGGGDPGSPSDIWWDDILVVEGTYLGPYFDGSSPPIGDPNADWTDSSSDAQVGDAQTVWTGAAEASTSTARQLLTLAQGQNDEQYQADVDRFERVLHNVTATSGPLIVERLQSKADPELVAYVVEFTVVAGKPWIYSVTRPVTLTVTPTKVIDDVPKNLALYPSAELETGATVTIATNYAPNPSIETDVTGWVAQGVANTGTSPVAFISAARVTSPTEPVAAGTASFRSRLLGNNGTTAVNASRSYLDAYTIVPIAAGTGRRVSINIWAAILAITGTSPGTVINGLQTLYAFRAAGGGTIGGYIPFSTVAAGSPDLAGKAHIVKSLAVPATAIDVLVQVRADVVWSSSATASVNSDIRLYVDALAVSTP